METRILKRKRDETKETYDDRHSKLYVTLQHSLSSTLEVSGSPLSGRSNEELTLTWRHVGSKVGPKNTLARPSLAKAKECCLDRFTKVDGQNGVVPSALTKNPVSVRTLCLTANIQPNSCMMIADLKCTTLSVDKSALGSSQCSTAKTTIFFLTGKSGGRLVERSNPQHTHHILHRTSLTLLRPKIDGVIWEKDDEFMQEEAEDQGDGQQILAERGRRYAAIPSDRHLTPTPSPKTPEVVTCYLFWAPTKKDTPASVLNFFKWIESMPSIKAVHKLWSAATKTATGLIRVPFESDYALAAIRASEPAKYGIFILVSFTADTVKTTANLYPPEFISPLAIHPVPHDLDIKVAAMAVAWRGTDPSYGPLSHVHKPDPETVQVSTWNPWKRNQILRHHLVDSPMAKISPVEPEPGTLDRTAVILYNQGEELDTHTVNRLVDASLNPGVPRPLVVAQFANGDTEIQKWLLGYIDHNDVNLVLANREWTTACGAHLGAKITVGPYKGKPAATKTQPFERKNNTKAKGNAGGHSRGNKARK